MNIGVLGIGLIGGSFALALKKCGWAKMVFGIDHNPNHLEVAQQLQIIDDSGKLEEVLPQVDVLIIAIPVDATREVLSQILDLTDKQVIIDAGSTKSALCASVKQHPKRQQYVAAHPIAGTENSGPEAAFAELYTGKVNIICDKNDSSTEALALALEMFNHLQMKTHFMGADEHDRHIAYVSHLSHISSFVLGQTVLEIEKDEKNIFNMAGSGFASTVRLAKSSPDMWSPIFVQNKAALSEALDAYIQNLTTFKKLLDSGNPDELHRIMKEANRIRKVLDS